MSAELSDTSYLSTIPLEKIARIDADAIKVLLTSMIQVRIFHKNPALIQHSIPDQFDEFFLSDFPFHEDERKLLLNALNALLNISLSLSNHHITIRDLATKIATLWQNSAHKITFTTSGTTGTPKTCQHSEESIRQELCAVLPSCSSCTRAAVTVPLEHMYGFTFGLLLPRSLDIPIYVHPPLPTFVLRTMTQGLLLVSMPLLWEKLTQLAAQGHDLKGTQIVAFTGTAPIEETCFRLLSSFGFSVREIYGATECGAIGLRKEHEACFTLLPHWQRTNDLQLTRTFVDGQLFKMEPLDHLLWHDLRHFSPQGRRDHAVQVAGINVYPAHVEKILLKHPCVQECSVRLMRKEEGDRLKAFIVLSQECTDPSDSMQSIRAFAAKHLAEECCPKSYTLGSYLPKNSLGKLCDW